MTDTLWLIPKNGDGQLSLIVDEYGRLVLCGECPCGEETDCIQAVGDKVDEMLLEVDPTTQEPIWDLLGTHTCDYQCAVWEYDDENDTWSLVSQADGHLLVALPIGTVVSDTAQGSATLLVYAKTLINTQTLEKVTIGCQCRVSQHECKHSMVTLRDCNIAGQLPVWEPDEGESYSPADGCRVDVCELLKLKLTTAQLWHGGTMMGEGYYDWLLTPQQWEPANYRYQPFLQAIKWQFSATTYAITYINCDCTSISTHNLAAGETCLEYAGICTLEDPCIALMLLHNKAEANGWTWHDEGLLLHKVYAECSGTRTYGDWYDIDSYRRCMAMAESQDTMYIVVCGCYLETLSKPATPADYYLYLDYPDACVCVDKRELVLAYPEVFGVLDISYGNHSKFRFTSSYYDPLSGWINNTGVGICSYAAAVEGGCDSYGGNIRTLSNNYIDYRCFCYVHKVLTDSCEQKVRVERIDPQGSYAGSWSGAGNYDTAEFIGHLVPFATDPDFSGFGGTGVFGGQVHYWSCYIGFPPQPECYDTDGDAQAVCARPAPSRPSSYDCTDMTVGMPEFGVRVSPPDYTMTLVPCVVQPEPGSTRYCATPAHWVIGHQVGENTWVVYREQYIETNKGWLRYGVPGYVPSFTLYGVEGPATQPWEIGSICHDRVLVARVDESMHGCHADTDWGFE